MTISNGYITAAEFKAATSGGITGSGSDSDIERAIEAASRAIDHFCRRSEGDVPHGFWQDSVVAVRYYTAEHNCLVVTDDLSTTTGLIVQTDPGDDGTFEYTWTLNTDFRLTPVNASADGAPWTAIEVLRSGNYRFPPHAYCVKVTAKFGWASTPTDVKQACLLQSQRYFARLKAPFGVAGSNEFGVVRLLNKLDPDVEMMVKPFRRLRLPGQKVAWQ